MPEPSEPLLKSLGLVGRYVEAFYGGQGNKKEEQEQEGQEEEMVVAMIEVEDL